MRVFAKADDYQVSGFVAEAISRICRENEENQNVFLEKQGPAIAFKRLQDQIQQIEKSDVKDKEREKTVLVFLTLIADTAESNEQVRTSYTQLNIEQLLDGNPFCFELLLLISLLNTFKPF